jgi:hypothetical protein
MFGHDAVGGALVAGRYHPLYDGIWNDEKFEGAPFEQIGFFVYLFGNPRQRPSGIYRVTDQQAASDTHLTLVKVRLYFADLDKRQAIVRDSVWIFVRGYFGRQPKQAPLLTGVKKDISECSSMPILEAFGQKYPHYRQWSADRLATFTGPSPDRQPTLSAPKLNLNLNRTKGPSGDGPDSTVAHATGSNDPRPDSSPEQQLAQHEANKQRARELLQALERRAPPAPPTP